MKYSINRAKAKKFLILFGFVFAFAQNFAIESFAQKQKAAPKTVKKQIVTSKANLKTTAAQSLNLPKVTQIDEIALKNLLKRVPHGKPLLVNFWATWCDPCREEFPELVKINADYAGKIDFVTISLDDLAEINRDVPKFLAEMKATMPAYLLKTEDEQTAISTISKDYAGGLPFTILFNGKGETVYSIQGKVKPEILREQIDKVSEQKVGVVLDKNAEIRLRLWKEVGNSENPYQKGMDEAWNDIFSGKLQIIAAGEGTSEKAKLFTILKSKYAVETIELGCKMSDKLIEYIKGYNDVSTNEIKQKFGDSVLGAFKSY